MIYVIGPSHIHHSFTELITPELESRTLFADCILDGYPGLPNWSKYIDPLIEDHTRKGHTVVWLVSDYKFNNSDYEALVKVPPGQLLLDTIGKPNNVSTNYCTPEHITCLAEHSLANIDAIVRKYPAIKLIFWCLYKRTKANANSSYPRPYWYDTVKTRYPVNIIDIDAFTNPHIFNACIRDEGAHPNKAGYVLLDTMILSITPLQVSPPEPPRHSPPPAQTSPTTQPVLDPSQHRARPLQSSPLQSRT